MRKDIPCVICKKPVSQETRTSVPRQTCKRKKVDGVFVKSECEKEKNRRYQKAYRKNGPMRKRQKPIQEKSIALSGVKHLAKHKARKYKRRCLKCREKFVGVGAYNRICNTCAVVNSRMKPLRGA